MSPALPAITLNSVGILRSQRWILRDINWTIPRSACAAILGPNGSGKSTLARIITGRLFPTSGTCTILGQTLGQTDLISLRKQIALVQPAGPADVDGELTALEVTLTGLFGTLGLYDGVTQIQQDEARQILGRVGLSHVIDHLYHTLSSGERVRALIARALIRRPDLLLLDEPTAGLDLLAREQILATIQRLSQASDWRPTIILITHHVEELPPAVSHVLLLADGKSAAAGRPDEVLTADILSRVYGCAVQVRKAGGRYYVEVHPGAWVAWGDIG